MQLLQLFRSFASMTIRHTRIASFDARSLLLIATLTLGGAGALQAQTSSPFSTGPGAAPSSGATVGPAAAPAAKAPAAFDRADTNQDGQLSQQEATRLPAISQRFKELDADGNGTLSRAEIDKGTKP
jgi:hypothetical protein